MKLIFKVAWNDSPWILISILSIVVKLKCNLSITLCRNKHLVGSTGLWIIVYPKGALTSIRANVWSLCPDDVKLFTVVLSHFKKITEGLPKLTTEGISIIDGGPSRFPFIGKIKALLLFRITPTFVKVVRLFGSLIILIKSTLELNVNFNVSKENVATIDGILLFKINVLNSLTNSESF